MLNRVEDCALRRAAVKNRSRRFAVAANGRSHSPIPSPEPPATSVPEVLLRPNLRVIYVGTALPAVLVIVGLTMAIGPWQPAGWLRAVGWIMAGLGGLLICLFALQSRQPRIAYEAGHLLLYLRSGPPIRLPVELAQCAFLGAGPTPLPGSGEMRTANLVIRLDETAADWANIAVKPALGNWSDGYITIHGAWCEPLTLDVVQRLNLRLHEINQPASESSTTQEANPS
jgi:hypothetical protein